MAHAFTKAFRYVSETRNHVQERRFLKRTNRRLNRRIARAAIRRSGVDTVAIATVRLNDRHVI